MHTVAEGWDSINSELYFRDTGTVSRVDKIAATARNQHGDTVILLDTMNEIKVTIKQSNKGNGEISSRRFEIRCSVDNYEKTNRSLRTRHPYIFQASEYTFIPHNDLIRSMPFDWVNNLKPGVWTRLETKWKKRLHLVMKQAKSQSIYHVRFISRRICESEFDTDAVAVHSDSLVYQISLLSQKEKYFYVTMSLIWDLLGEEAWMNHDMNTLANIGSGRTVTVSWGAKKKSNTSHSSFISVGDIVEVDNHGTKGVYSATIMSISENTAVVKWTTTLLRETVKLSDCKLINAANIHPRKRQMTDRFVPGTKGKSDNPEEQPEPTKLPGQLSNKYYSAENLNKNCAEGSIANLMYMLGFTEKDIDLFWTLSRQSVFNVSSDLGETIPHKVLTKSGVVDSIECCLWILRRKFNFITTGKLRSDRLTSISRTMEFLEQAKFPLLIAVRSSQALYDHVVVVWNKKIIDYESMYTIPLSSETITELCGVTTKFQSISCGYGLIPPKTHRPPIDQDQNQIEWGLAELYHGGTHSIKGYFST